MSLEDGCDSWECLAGTDGELEYRVEDSRGLELCSSVDFKGQRLKVYRIREEFTEGAWRRLYYLRRESGFYTAPYHNGRICGCSLIAEVARVEEDWVQLKMQCEDIRGESPKRYQMATVYSSPQGTGWYCMPEEGDTVRLYFPDQSEDLAYVVSAVHLGSVDGLRVDPEQKSIRTVHDKEIRLTPHGILITNHKGSEIEIDDEKGISLKTDHELSLAAGDGVLVSSQGQVLIEADDGIMLSQGTNSMIIRDGIRQHGLNVRFR